MNNQQKYWEHTIYRTGNRGEPEIVAVYISQTSPAAVQADLASDYSHLRDYLERFFRCSADQYAKDHALRAEALLGAMSASLDCSLRTGLWLPVEPPPSKHIPDPGDIGKPIKSEGGVNLWIKDTKVHDPASELGI
jgi:hypothetical protein